MISEKVTWVQFPGRISTFRSKLPPINDSAFQFLVKHLHICSYKFSYRKSDPEIYSAMLNKFCIFSPIFKFFYADLAILRKTPF